MKINKRTRETQTEEKAGKIVEKFIKITSEVNKIIKENKKNNTHYYL